MPQKHPTLWHVRQQHGITRELIDQFKKKAIDAGQNPTAVLAELLHRHVEEDSSGQSAAPSQKISRGETLETP